MAFKIYREPIKKIAKPIISFICSQNIKSINFDIIKHISSYISWTLYITLLLTLFSLELFFSDLLSSFNKSNLSLLNFKKIYEEYVGKFL